MAPEKYGGAGGDFGFAAVMIEELARENATGLGFSMHSDVVAPYITKVRYRGVEAGMDAAPDRGRGDWCLGHDGARNGQ